MCENNDFLKCVSINNQECTEIITTSLKSCDHENLYEKVENTDDYSFQTNPDLRETAMNFGSCINENIYLRLKVESVQYEFCIESAFERHNKLLKDGTPGTGAP